jgi:hypothetical protein
LIIKVERTGGFSGMSEYSEMDSDDLPEILQTTLTNFINEKVNASNSLKSMPKGAADHYSYRITVDDGAKSRVIECSQYDIKDDLKSLVAYVKKHNVKRM